MSLVLTICHIIRLYKCEHCTLTYSNKITLVWFLHFFFYLGGRWFSKILRNIWGWYVKILTIPYRGRWVVWKRPKTPLRNIKMAPYHSDLKLKIPFGNCMRLHFWVHTAPPCWICKGFVCKNQFWQEIEGLIYRTVASSNARY